MPFTFSHPALVLPLFYLPKKARSVTGLVVGSIVPDFEKFFRMRSYDTFSHTWESIFYFNLPLAILLTFVFHLVVRNPLIDNLPLFFKRRLLPYKNFDWLTAFKEHYPVILLSMLAGIVSHLVWDSFTHPEGTLAQLLPVLSEWVGVFNQSMLMSTFIDRISSIAGGLVVIIALIALPVKEMPPEPDYQRNKYWFIVALCTVFIITVRLLIDIDPQNFIWDFIVSAVAAILLSVTATSYLIR